LGYARISVQFLLVNAEATPSVELHEPMVLDTLIDLVYRERSRTIRSMPGREAMRANMKKTLQKKFKEETGKEIIKEVFFTQFLVH
jgi:flagellar FliL protein